jgi:hypothetical protein
MLKKLQPAMKMDFFLERTLSTCLALKDISKMLSNPETSSILVMANLLKFLDTRDVHNEVCSRNYVL